MRATGLVAVAAWLGITSGASGQEFNWVPCGTIAVGDRASEAAAQYEASGAVRAVELAYRGEAVQRVGGRLVTGAETFIIRPASWRGGPATAALVIVRTCDTAAVPGPLTVKVGDREVGRWRIAAPAGERRLFDALFVLPRGLFPNRNPPEQVKVTVAGPGDEPALSLGYRFYAASDWDVLGDELAGDVAAHAAAESGAPTPAQQYLLGLLAEADHDLSNAEKVYRALRTDDERLARLTRTALRRVTLRQARQAAAAADAQDGVDTAKMAGRLDVFARHYRLGLLAGAWGCWEDALAELRVATQAHPTHAEATYRLAEAMEYNRRPIAEWAPLFERAGMLAEAERVAAGGPPANVQDVLIAIHTDPVAGLCGTFSHGSLEALQRDWRYVEQQVYGAARGAWKLRTHYMVCGPTPPGQTPAFLPWVMQAGWIFLPPDEAVPVAGTYDYSIGTAEYGSSHAGGVDCGVNGSGGAQIGPTRSWEVLLHEWNHQFDWVCIFGEQVPGYPVTHDSDGCGKQPIVSMGCGHRSSMYYYINPAQYRRHEASDPLVSEGFVGVWSLLPPIAAPEPPDGTAEELGRWLVGRGRFTAQDIERFRRDWETARQAEQERRAKPPVVPSQPPPRPVGDWAAFLKAQWLRVSLLDELAAADEAALVAGEFLPATLNVPINVEGPFVDLGRQFPAAPQKCVAYARTFIDSPVDQEVRMWLGYNDTAAVWLNGRRIHAGKYYACAKWEDLNRPAMLGSTARLAAGWNTLVVKVERGGGDWGFSVHFTDFDNRPLSGLKVSPLLGPGQRPHRYAPPPVGPYYRWSEVRDDYLERLPHLTAADLARFTGIPGLKCRPHKFHLDLPTGVAAVPGSRYVAEPSENDRALNNHLNWDVEAAAALRYTKDGEVRDLLWVRPEYFEEFLTLLAERPGAVSNSATWPGSPADRLLGCLVLAECEYATTPSRGARAVLVLDTRLPDYPIDDLDLLEPK